MSHKFVIILISYESAQPMPPAHLTRLKIQLNKEDLKSLKLSNIGPMLLP